MKPLWTLTLGACTLLASAAAQNPRPNTIDSIHAPVVVGIPPCDAFIGLCLMPDGEIRHYNYGSHPASPAPGYLSSRDSGLTWHARSLAAELPAADQRSPLSGEYIRLFCVGSNVYALRTEGGLAGGRTITKIDSVPGIMNKPPIFIRNGTRVISGAHRIDRSGAFVYISDDDGRTWHASQKVTAPDHQKGGFHQGTRWNHGAVEPTIVELQDGRLWMIMRTAQDHHYQSFSEDGGETWTPATPSPFYGTITMPTLHRLGDGRLLFLWCNTTPLPELPTANGVWDDVFTNRCVLHAAVSEDDGRSWTGFREFLLDPDRNAANYGITRHGEDKSVHQAQAIEVAPGKILVSAGQHRLSRRMVLFDVDWLYDTVRTCDFSDGLDSWTAFRYYRGITGHCCYNRQLAPLLVSHPDDSARKALCIRYQPNDSLVQDNDGALWNFPASPSGEVTLSLRIPQGAAAVELLLNDRWFNPTDTVARYAAPYRATLDRRTLGIRDDRWHSVTIRWSEGRAARLMVDGRRRTTLPLQNATEHGPSYLHLLGGHTPDSVGVWVERVEARKLPLR